MDRHWLLTWTTYGTWLPGDRRGFVSPVLDEVGNEVVHNVPGTRYDADLPALRQFFRNQMKGPSVHLKKIQAVSIVEQFQETARYRHWSLPAAAVMANYVHLVVGVVGDPNPSNMLRDFKSYASRVLNRRWCKPVNGTWWTESGSKRKLPDEGAVLAAIRYVKNQARSLAVWVDEGFSGGCFDDQQGADAPRSPIADAPRSPIVDAPGLPKAASKSRHKP